jgi:predicted AlkP superfamily phosphohydrolase/phosphomutase
MGTAVVGLWATWPPEPLANGLVISDHASLARRQEWLDREKTSTLTAGTTTYPPELEERFAAAQRPPASVTREELGEFLDVDDAVWADFQETLAFSKDVDISAFRSSHLNDEFYLTAATEIWQEERPDLMVVYAKAIDQLSHFFYEMGTPEAPGLGHSAEQIERYGGVVDRIYAWTDRKIAPLVELAASDPNTLLLIVSDHGWEQEKDGGYNHSYAPPGILILFGADVCTSDCAPLPEVSIYDVAPTVLERLGLPLSDEFVGAPIPAFRSPNPTSTVAMYGPPLGEGGVIQSDLDQEMLEKLRALGYIE